MALRPAHAVPGDTDSFITTWKTDNPGSSNNSSITIGTEGGGYLYDVDWNDDGVFDEFDITGNATHDFGTPGTYTIRIKGEFPRLLASNGDVQKLVGLKQWGTIRWTSMENAFAGASNMTSTTVDSPDLSQVTSLRSMFEGAALFNQDLSTWDTSNVTTVRGMFSGATSFNGNVGTWNLSKVDALNYMFSGATSFNQPVGNWDVSNVLYADGMFSGATSFNQDVSGWDTANLNSTYQMFSNASSFNFSLASFNMSNVVDATGMINGTALSSNNIDATLKAWSTQDVLSNVNLGTIQYCTAGDAIDVLVMTYNWIIQSTKSCQSFLSGGLSIFIQDGTVTGSDLGVLTVSNYATSTNNPYQIACNQPAVDDSRFVINGDILQAAVTFSFDQPSDQNADNIYEVCVRTFGSDGSGFDTNFTVQVVARQQITSATFNEAQGRKTLNVTGISLLSGNESYATALDRSMVRLNGQDLRFCSDGFGMTAQQMIDAYSSFYPNIAQNVTDNPPCYFIIMNGAPALDATSATIWLPDNFDITARGTVSVNNSPVYTFNPNAGGGDVEPTVDVNGNKDIDANPTIPTLPTFTGVAEPGATIVVTVHSDPVTCTTTADQDGRWSCTLSTALPAGAHTVFVQITNPDSSVVELGPYSVVVAGVGGGVIDNNTPLAPNTGFLAKHAEVLKEMKQKEIIGISTFLVTGALIGLFVGTGSLAVYRRLKN